MSTISSNDPRIPEVPRAPAPWSLTGDSYIAMIELPERARQDERFTPAALRGRLEGHFSLLMLIDYKSSNVGPYRELIYIPGRFRVGGALYWSITRIFVSSWDSVVNGQINWGIPKEFADFEIVHEADGGERFIASQEGRSFADVKFKTYGPPLPSSAALMPEAMRTLVHHRDGQLYFCAPFARGRVRYARMVEARVSTDVLPDLNQGKVIFAVRLSDFRMDFPVARVEPAG